MTAVQWVKYDGSDEQIAEIRQSIHGFIARNTSSLSSIMSVKLNQLFISGQKNPYLPELFGNKVSVFLNYNNTTHYLICNPHPYADMIRQWAKTGQPVWVKTFIDGSYTGLPIKDSSIYVTNTPDWNIPGAEYSFEPFEEEL